MIHTASELRSQVEGVLERRIPRALTPPQRSAPELLPTGIDAVDSIAGGIPLGCLTEICGGPSSGRTSVLMALIAQFMGRGELCALIDTSDTFDPHSAARGGVDLDKLLWVRGAGQQESGDRVIGSSGEVRATRTQRSAAHAIVNGTLLAESRKPTTNSRFTSSDSQITRSPDHPITRFLDDPITRSLKSTDLLLQAGGFGLIVLDLADVPVTWARRIPLTTWFRFRRAVEHTSTALVVVEAQSHAKSCASLILEFSSRQSIWTEASQPSDTIVGAHCGAALDGVGFRVTSQGVAIPFDRPGSSFEMPQRWNTPRLLNSVHVHLEVTRSRALRDVQKFPARPERVGVFYQQPGVNTKDTKVGTLMN